MPVASHDIDTERIVEDAVDTHTGGRAALEALIASERFTAELCRLFVDRSSNQLADAIQTALGLTLRHFDLDLCTIAEIGVEGDVTSPIREVSPAVAERPLFTVSAEDLPWTMERVLAGDSAVFATVDEIPNETDRAAFRTAGTRSAVFIPLALGDRVAGVIGFAAMREERQWPPGALRALTTTADVFDQVLSRKHREDALRATTQDVDRLKEQLQAENVYLEREKRERLGFTRVVGQSAAVRRVMEQIQQVATTDATVLLRGETGTGKELFATQIHEMGPRHSRPMVRVNCAAIPATLIESELFGREKGAFTGALARQIGRFELADRSTIFLDEIGDLSADVQVKLLRVLEEHTIERLGSPRPITVNTRIIAATHRNLEQRIAEGLFREDLYYRLNVFPIHVPPLRERVEDVPLLVWRFVEEFSRAFGRRIDTIDKENLTMLQQYPWPGNIRELRNVVERAMILANSRRLTIPLPHAPTAAAPRSSRLIEVERDHIRAVLEATGWRIRGTGGAADRLGLKPTTLETRMAKLGLKRPGHA